MTNPDKHAQASRPRLMAVQKLEVMIAMVSSPSPRFLMPKAGNHVAVACSRPLAKKHNVQIATWGSARNQRPLEAAEECALEAARARARGDRQRARRQGQGGGAFAWQ